MSRSNQVGTVATTISNDGVHTIIMYHSTPVVRFNQDEIILQTGGYFSQTTKRRMNQASQQYNLGYDVYQQDFEWFVIYKERSMPLLLSGLCLNRHA